MPTSLRTLPAKAKGMEECPQPHLFTTPVAPKKRLKRVKFNVSFPGEAMPFIHAQRRRLKMNMNQFVNSLVAYQCWCEKQHQLTGDPVREGGDSEARMWAEIIADTGREKKTGSFFAHRAAEVILRALDR